MYLINVHTVYRVRSDNGKESSHLSQSDSIVVMSLSLWSDSCRIVDKPFTEYNRMKGKSLENL